jgi:hypothetical protein
MTQARSCTATFAAVPPPGCDLGAEQDCRNNGGTWDSEICECQYWWLDPLLIPLDGRHLHLTSVTAGVGFDVNGDGVRDRVAWTLPGARMGFLVLDRNGNGVVDSLGELFGQAVSGSRRPARLRRAYGGSAVALRALAGRRRNGPATSLADLALFDRPEQGGNGDGRIGPADAVFAGPAPKEQA